MNQLEKRKFRKGAVHSKKNKDKSEKHKRNCNICHKKFTAYSRFERFCEMCKQEDEYKFAYELSTFGKGQYIT